MLNTVLLHYQVRKSMTALLMRCQVIPANFLVFIVIDLIFEIPRDHMLLRVKNNNNKTTVYKVA